MHRLENQLTQLELKHGVTVRWDNDDPQYTCARLDCLREKKQNLQSSLWATISRIKAVPFKVEEKICWYQWYEFCIESTITCIRSLFSAYRWTKDCEKALQGYLKGIQ